MQRAVLALVFLASAARAARTAPADSVVVARVVDAGPIGDGACSQRSYQIEIDKQISGPAPAAVLWVHFERCGRAPGPTDLAGTGMRTGRAYHLTLRAGASKNFGSGFMIVAARAP